MLELYDLLPPEYRFSLDPEELIKVWRGDKLGKAVTGMLCKLNDKDAARITIVEAARQGRSALNRIIDNHTWADPSSPLVSVTNSIARAQKYAMRKDETIHEMLLPAKSLIRDPCNIGSPNKGNNTELFVVGGIEPSYITAVKTNNTDQNALELLAEHEQTGNIVTVLINPFSAGPNTELYDTTKRPNKYGVWDRSRQWVTKASRQ